MVLFCMIEVIIVNMLIKEWYVLIIVVIVKDKIIVKDNIGVGDE